MWTIDILRAELIRQQGRGTQLELARRLALSPQYVCDVLKGKRKPGPKLLRAMSLEEVVLYRRVR